MSDSDDVDKTKLAEQTERFGDYHRDLVVGAVKQMLRVSADVAARIAAPYEHDGWAREWVDLVKRAVADLRAAEARVQIQPLAPHGEVPS